jgi:hypothetical protein
MKQFGWLYQVSTHIPEWLVALVHPLTKELFKLRQGKTPSSLYAFLHVETPRYL